MGLSILEAAELLKNGDGEKYISCFIGAVKFAVASGNSAAISLDDALVASMALARLIDTTEGRKLLKRQKRQNTQFKAREFRMGSPQRNVVIAHLKSGAAYKDSLRALGNTFSDPPDDRTIKRLFDDLVADQNAFNQNCVDLLLAAGAIQGDQESQRIASLEILSNIGYQLHVPAK
ncbi:MAG: hypothetical protein IPJ12_00715 [Betaproteobacteria bacterium]|nr:hypothetical protein [Betaproteobacteria bacterium]